MNGGSTVKLERGFDQKCAENGHIEADLGVKSSEKVFVVDYSLFEHFKANMRQGAESDNVAQILSTSDNQIQCMIKNSVFLAQK